MADQIIPVQGNPFSNDPPRDLGEPGHQGGARNADTHQPANRAQQQFLAQYNAAGGYDENAPVGSARHPYGMFPQSPDPLRSAMPPNSYFVDFDGKIKQVAQDTQGGGHPHVVTIGGGSAVPVQGDPFAAEPHMGYGEDAARSFLPGVGKGAAGIAGLPGEIENGVAWAAKHGYGAMQDATGSRLGEPYMGANHGQRVYLDKDGAIQSTNVDDWGTGGLPTVGDVNTGIQHTFGVYHQPQHWTGRATDTLGQMLPNALFPGGLTARGGRVLLPALGSELAGELAHGTDAEPWARVGGAVAGGGVQGVGESLAAKPLTLIGNSTKGVGDEVWQKAAELRQSAAAQGITLSIPEAVQQVTNGATGLGRLQRLTENFGHTAPGWQSYYAERPQQVRDAVMSLADAVAPSHDAPGMTALDAQRAAEGAQFAANRARAAVAGPHYQAADAQDVDHTGMADILQGLDGQIAGDKTGLVAPVLTRFRNSLTEAPAQAGTPPVRMATQAPAGTIFHMTDGQPAAPATPITNIGDLSTARNYWRDAIDNPPVGTDPLTKYQSGIIGGHLDNLDALLRTNPNRQLGDAAFADLSRLHVDPLNAGPVGKIAGTTDLGSQTSALYPMNPPLGAADETRSAMQALALQDPNVGAQLTRQHIGTAFNQATRDLTSGPNQYGGALFARALLGNPEQASTLRAGMDAIDPTSEASSALDNLADILRATGRRERPGSMTAFNEADKAALTVPPSALNIVSNPLEWGEHAKHAAGMALFQRNTDQLAQLLRDPDTLAVLQQAARNRSNGWASSLRSMAPGGLQLEDQQGAQ